LNEGQGRTEGTLTKIRDVYIEINGKHDRRNRILRRDNVYWSKDKNEGCSEKSLGQRDSRIEHVQVEYSISER
jgi:hypothetical protein